MTAKPKRRWLQFSLKSFLIVVTLFAVWLGYFSLRAREQRAAVARIKELGGHVQYDYQWGSNSQSGPPGWPWLRRLVGDEYFQEVTRVWLDKTQVSDADLRVVSKLRHTRSLSLNWTDISDEGLASIHGISELTYLGLCKTKVTSEGIRLLPQQLTGCTLVLAETSVGDDALSDLSGCEMLNLDETHITSHGIQELADSKTLSNLAIQHTAVDDAAVPFLAQIKSLTWLHISGTRISGEGLISLRSALPQCRIDGNWEDLSSLGPLDGTRGQARWKMAMDTTQYLNKEKSLKLLVLSNPSITDDHLALLEGLDNLESLDLRGASVTDAGVEKLQKALPKLKIHR
jgi:internalin A